MKTLLRRALSVLTPKYGVYTWDGISYNHWRCRGEFYIRKLAERRYWKVLAEPYKRQVRLVRVSFKKTYSGEIYPIIKSGESW